MPYLGSRLAGSGKKGSEVREDKLLMHKTARAKGK